MTHPPHLESDVRQGNAGTGLPRTTVELRLWLRGRFSLSAQRQIELMKAVELVLANQRQLIEESKHEAIRALSQGFAGKLEKLKQQLSEKDVTVSNIARYFEDVVAELTEKAHRDPKTKLLNFDWFMDRLESFLSVEQRGRWCSVGVVDITSFKWYNDTLGHALGDRIINRVAQILADQIRSKDLLAVERSSGPADLHARFGGDEFCFLIPDLPGCPEAAIIADRFKQAVARHDWAGDDERLRDQPVGVDVGMVCLRLGPVSEHRAVARQVATQLIHRADTLMYKAKSRRSPHVHSTTVRVENGSLVDAGPIAHPDGDTM